MTSLDKIEKKFSQLDLENATSQAFDFLVTRTKEMKAEALLKFSQEASLGIPFKNRSPDLQKKIAWCDSEIQRLNEMRKNHIVKPFQFWEVDNWDTELFYMKQVGFKRYVELNLEKVIYSSAQDWEQACEEALSPETKS